MPYQSLTQQQVRQLLRAIPHARDRAAMTVAYLHGLRVSELNSIRVRDTEGGSLHIPRLKGSAKTTQPLISAPSDEDFNERAMLRSLLQSGKFGPDDLLFPKSRSMYWRIVKKAGLRVGIPEALAHPHVLKHSIAYHLADQGMDIKDLQTYLGHKSMASTGIYLESSDAKASAAVLKIMVGK